MFRTNEALGFCWVSAAQAGGKLSLPNEEEVVGALPIKSTKPAAHNPGQSSIINPGIAIAYLGSLAGPSTLLVQKGPGISFPLSFPYLAYLLS